MATGDSTPIAAPVENPAENQTENLQQPVALNMGDYLKLKEMSEAITGLTQFQSFAMQQIQENAKSLTGIEALLQQTQQHAPAAAVSPLPAMPSPVVQLTETPRDLRINDPTPFEGKKSELRNFLTQLRMTIQAQPSRFLTEHSKCLFAASYLRGTAFHWVQPLVDQDPIAPELQDFPSFLERLRLVFGDPDEKASAERQLTSLRQTGPTATYATEFLRISAVLGWNQEALVYTFYNGLKDPVKDELAKMDRPRTLTAIMELATRIDNRLQDRFLERRGAPGPRPTPRPMQQPTPALNWPPRQPPQPMDIDGVRPRPQPRPPLTAEEKQRRRDLNLCLYCGEPNHLAANCPAIPAARYRGPLPRLAAATTSYTLPTQFPSQAENPTTQDQ